MRLLIAALALAWVLPCVWLVIEVARESRLDRLRESLLRSFDERTRSEGIRSA